MSDGQDTPEAIDHLYRDPAAPTCVCATLAGAANQSLSADPGLWTRLMGTNSQL